MEYTMLAILLHTLLLTTPDLKATVQTIDTKADFRGLSVVSDTVAWVSGTKGTICRTTDAGSSWQVTQTETAFHARGATAARRGHILTTRATC